jgi:carbon monoxide dehydrogenase subunit G
VRLEQSFEVQAPIDRVWRALIDVEHVAPCLPGASITGRGEDGSYEGAFSVKIGPTSASYTGRLEMADVDEAAHTATMQADGTDRRGQGGATARIFSRLSEASSGVTRVEVDTDYRITGRLARFGRGGMIEDISEKLLRQFAENLQASLATPEPEASTDGAEPPPVVSQTTDTSTLDAGALVGSVLRERIRRNPWPLLALTGLLVLWARKNRGRA